MKTKHLVGAKTLFRDKTSEPFCNQNKQSVSECVVFEPKKFDKKHKESCSKSFEENAQQFDKDVFKAANHREVDCLKETEQEVALINKEAILVCP